MSEICYDSLISARKNFAGFYPINQREFKKNYLSVMNCLPVVL